uniref:Uncharacterized protein n=1 Tax=Anopheles atroparvus TaxID=41427 RepID=A0A182IZP9_ANOAO
MVAPPSSIKIQGYSQHAKAEVREGQDLSLTCLVPNAKPAAQIVWYRANVEYKSVPPGPPIISGYTEGSIIPTGSKQKLMCVSSGGNPLATLTWYKNDKKVSVD